MRVLLHDLYLNWPAPERRRRPCY